MIALGFSLLIASGSLADLSPASNLQVRVVPEVEFSVPSGRFIYRYLITNSKASSQSLIEFEVAVDDSRNDIGGSVSDLQVPSSKPWFDGTVGFHAGFSRSVVGWTAGGPEIHDLNELRSPPAGALLAGESASGFSYSAAGLPGIQVFYARGFVRPPTEAEVLARASTLSGTLMESMDEIPATMLRKILPPPSLDSFKGVTVGAQAPSSGQLQSVELIARLVEFKEEAARLGWIKSPGTVRSLNKKLAAAKKALGRTGTGKVAAARILKAFVHELNAQRGKHVNESAYFLLRANAEYLVEVKLK